MKTPRLWAPLLAFYSSLLLLSACDAQIPREASQAVVNIPAVAQTQESKSAGAQANLKETLKSAGVTAQSHGNSQSVGESQSQEEPIRVDGREAVKHSIEYRGKKIPLYVFKDLHVLSFRQDSMPPAVAELLDESIKPVPERWSEAFLQSRGCLVVSANEETWKSMSDRLKKLREEGKIWAVGQVVTFSPTPKSPKTVVLDRIAFDSAQGDGVEQLREFGAKAGFRVATSEKRPPGFPTAGKYVATPDDELSAIDLVHILSRSELVTKVQPTWVSPISPRE